MQISRRRFGVLAAGSAGAQMMAAPQVKDYWVYVGTYTNGPSKGIYAWKFTPSSGKLVEAGLMAETPNPTFLAVHPGGRILFAANEISKFGEERAGSVTSFLIDPATAKLKQLSAVSSRGPGPCYVSVDAAGKYVFTANYGGGSVAVLPVSMNGELGESTAFAQHQGSSVNPKRQTGPHAHCIQPSPDSRFVLATDLGTDNIYVYRFDGGTGKLSLNTPPSIKMRPGAGPRHMAFHPNGKILYCINELHSTVTMLNWDAQKGALTDTQTVSTLPGTVENNSTAEVVVHPSGRWLYGSNRGHNSIAVFSIDRGGKLTPEEYVSTQGAIPRNFALDPTGNFLFAANQNSGDIYLFRVRNGKLVATGDVMKCGSPVCVRFAPAA